MIIMDKSQAVAYATIAMRKLGYDNVEIEKVTNAMVEEFEGYSQESAEDRADEILFNED